MTVLQRYCDVGVITVRQRDTVRPFTRYRGDVTVGLRVVRGNDWQWDDQDGGDGFVGTVVEIGGQGNSTKPDDTVDVIWDTRDRGTYPVGNKGKDYLRVLDIAPGTRETVVLIPLVTKAKITFAS